MPRQDKSSQNSWSQVKKTEVMPIQLKSINVQTTEVKSSQDNQSPVMKLKTCQDKTLEVMSIQDNWSQVKSTDVQKAYNILKCFETKRDNFGLLIQDKYNMPTNSKTISTLSKNVPTLLKNVSMSFKRLPSSRVFWTKQHMFQRFYTCDIPKYYDDFQQLFSFSEHIESLIHFVCLYWGLP